MALIAFVYSGVYPIGAEALHNKLIYRFSEILRERSVARASADIEVPNLNDSELPLSGGPDYNDMGARVHLARDKQNDMSYGLYPSPPNLSLSRNDQGHADGTGVEHADHMRRQFWIIKHGIKASGMPAWGLTHEDQRL